MTVIFQAPEAFVSGSMLLVMDAAVAWLLLISFFFDPPLQWIAAAALAWLCILVISVGMSVVELTGVDLLLTGLARVPVVGDMMRLRRENVRWSQRHRHKLWTQWIAIAEPLIRTGMMSDSEVSREKFLRLFFQDPLGLRKIMIPTKFPSNQWPDLPRPLEGWEARIRDLRDASPLPSPLTDIVTGYLVFDAGIINLEKDDLQERFFHRESTRLTLKHIHDGFNLGVLYRGHHMVLRTPRFSPLATSHSRQDHRITIYFDAQTNEETKEWSPKDELDRVLLHENLHFVRSLAMRISENKF